MSLEADIRQLVGEVVDARLAAWELAQPRPRMMPLKEAAELLSVSAQTLRDLEPRLPLKIDRTGHTHAVSSVHVYALIEAGGIASVLDGPTQLRRTA